MSAQTVGESHRSISDRILRKTLAIGLGGSALLHTAAIAGASYFYQGKIEDLEITEIERVEVEPAPVAKPVAPIAKPPSIPEPKVFKPKITAAIPAPIPVEIPKPKPIPILPEVVKITKAAPVQPQTPPLANFTAPAPSPRKPATVTPPKSSPPPSFPNKLFNDPQPKPARTEIAARKIPDLPAQVPPKQDPQPTTAINQAALSAPSNKLPKLAPNPVPDSENNSAPNEELAPRSPGSTSKVARTPDRSLGNNNQASFTPQPKSPPKFGDDFGSADPNTPPSSDDFAGTPGNNARIAANIPATAPATNNQVGLGNSPQRGGIGASLGGGGGDNPSVAEEAIGGAPGNNARIAGSNGGGKGLGSQGNQTGLGGGNRRSPSLANATGGGNGNGSGNSGDDLGGGAPGNVATGSKNQATIQCLRNCEIRYPDELENADIGKDKILVKVTIDPNGLVASAEIARSSGNQNLDRVTLAGVKQMQLNPTGKTRTHRIKISTLLNN